MRKQEACFARATQVWLDVIHKTSLSIERIEKGGKVTTMVHSLPFHIHVLS